MQRWRYNVYRVPGENRGGEQEDKSAQGENPGAGTESDTVVWRQADSVYEDVM